MSKVNWNFKSSLISPAKINEISKEFGVSYVMATVLLNRGIETKEQLKEYIGKSLDAVHNPMLLPDMEKAAKRIIKAIDEKEKIAIYGDYDVDGVTATTLLYSFLLDNGADASYYIPDRIKEGYGLNIKAINKISKLGTKLLITVDCGVTSVGEVELAKAQKMEVIITDHHTCKERIPDALAVINPKRADSSYPFSCLAGVGVAFKLILAVTMLMGKNTKECFDKYVELAAMGTIADVVELKGENRVIADRGIQQLSKSTNEGIKAMLEIIGAAEKPINTTTISFMLAPRINAAGRMKDASLAVELLLSKTNISAYKLARELDEMNRNRQMCERDILNQALEMIKEDKDFENKKIIVLAREGWHHGVVGIVSSKISEMFYKPCILLAVEENGKAKGSGRSVEGINLFDALCACDDLLTQYGGHELAAGLSLDMKDFDAFCQKINKYLIENIKKEPQKTLDIDCTIIPEYITLANVKQLQRLEPFGMGNEMPVFAICGVEVVESSTMGIDNRHLKVKINAGGKIIEAVGFSFGQYANSLTKGKRIDIAFNLGINTYQNTDRVQLILKDIRSSKNV